MAKVALSYGHGSNTYSEMHSKGVTINGVQYAEHTHNYQVGTRVKAILERHGVQVLEVQPPNGRDVPLQTRTNQANAWGADLYWSIHANSADPSVRGWCAFYWASNSAAQGKAVADLYVKHVSALGLPLYHGGEWGSIKGTWNDFHELRETNMIACLTENGFMTNAEDFKKIFQNEGGHWDKLAEAHAKVILEHFGIAYKETAVPTPTASNGVPIYTDRVVIPNTAFWQAAILVQEFSARGYKCYANPLREYNGQKPDDNDPFPFVVETNFTGAHGIKIELDARGYDITIWETI